MNLRPPRADETAAVADLFNTTFPEPLERLAETVFERAWTAPGFDVERNARVAVEDGRIVGYAEVEDAADRHEQFWLWVRGEPAEELISFAQSRVAELQAGRARIFSGTWSGARAVNDALQAAGFRLVRHSYRMGIDLGGRLEAPAWPDGITVRQFEPGDERVVYDVHEETFEDSWEHVRRSYDEWAHWYLSPELHFPDLWFLAFDGDELAAIELCMPHQKVADVGWIGILGVRRPWRRRGLARGLLLHAFSEFQRREFVRVILGVDAESLTGAHKLYETVGMRVLYSFDIYEKLSS